MRLLILLLLLAGSAHAADLDLSYVNKTGPEYATFKAWVDRSLPTTNEYMFTATDAAYMAKLDGAAKYCVKAIALADTYAAKVEASIAAGGQPNWGADGNGSDGISSDSYLNVGGHIRDFALTMKWCQPSGSQITRWSAVAEQAITNVWNPSGAKWGGRPFPWTGWGTNDPANNYYYSFTLATQMWAWASGSQQWSTRLTTQTWPLLAGYMATIPTGGSEEGMGYGTSHRGLFEITRFQRQLFGNDYTDAHLTNSIYYWIHGTTPDLKHFAAIGDNSRISEPTLYDYQRAIVLQAMSNSPEAKARGYGAWWLRSITPPAMTSTFNYRDGLLNAGSGGAPPTELVYDGRSTGDYFARTGWDSGALWVAFRAGKYNQSHAHQDQGAFQMYQGTWLANDESIWTHSGVSQQDARNNNVIRFVKNGADAPQVYNSASTMTVTGNSPASGIVADANLSPAVAGSATWNRRFELSNRTLTVTDAYTPAAGVTGVWQVNTKAEPIISGRTATAGALTVTVLEPADAVLSKVDWRTVNSDYTAGWKLEVRSAANAGYKVALSTAGGPPPQECTNPAPTTTPACAGGGNQTGGSWARSAYPGCAWAYVGGTCPAAQRPILCKTWKLVAGASNAVTKASVLCLPPYTVQ